MNLIEQLGGYEKALDLFRGCPWDSGTVDVPNPRSKGMLRLDLSDLSYELLEYRRQHNIFEGGDYYVYLYGWDSDLDIVCKFNPSEWGDHLWNIKNMIRHATDAETKARKRRPELDSDTCSDIRNHVSPLTKVIDR